MPTLLNEPLGALFVHVPKTAGSSISRALRSYAPPATVTDPADLDRLDPDHWLGGERIDGVEQAIAHNLGMQGQRRSLAMGHARAMDIRKLIGPRRYDGLYSFAVVRNPFDRMASTYHYIRDNPDNGMRPMCLELGFEQFVVYSCLLTVQLQHDWLHDLAGRRLVQQVFRIEEMPDLGAQVGQRIYGHPIRIGHRNASSNAQRDRASSWDVVPGWVVDLFVKTYAADFDCTGYAPDVSPFKQRDSVSEQAENGAWEALPRHMSQRVSMELQRSRALEKARYIDTEVRPGLQKA